MTVTYGQRGSQYTVEAGGMAATNQTPFWLRANQYGTVPLTNPMLRVSAAVRLDYRPADSTGRRPRWDWGYGLNAVVNAGPQAGPSAFGSSGIVLLPEAYIKGRLGAFELYAGRRRETVGLADTLLTSGSYIWSGNALPMPKIQLALPAFTAIPFTKGVVSVLGAFNHGWFENTGRLTKGAYLHQAYLYGRLGKPTWRFRLYGGFNHEVMWAGYDPTLPNYIAVDGHLLSSIRYYPAVVLGTRDAISPSDKAATSFEENRIGNHLGSLDVGADVSLNHWNVLVYRQFVYDDGSLFYGTNLADGLNGFRLRNTRRPTGAPFWLRQLTLEYLFTGSQGGAEFDILNPKKRGRDDYFNNSQYPDGWTYFGRTIGTPFITPQTEVRATLPNHGIGLANNRVSAVHLGLSGLLFSKIELLTKLSISKNAGTYNVPYPTLPTQFSGLLMASVPIDWLGGTVLGGSLAVDAGGLLPNSVGGYVYLRRTGWLGRQSPGSLSGHHPDR